MITIKILHSESLRRMIDFNKFCFPTDYRKQGLAHQLLNHVTDEMNKIGMKRFCGETRSTNKGMQKVFEDCGYKLNRVEENYFQNPDESAYKYVLQL